MFIKQNGDISRYRKYHEFLLLLERWFGFGVHLLATTTTPWISVFPKFAMLRTIGSRLATPLGSSIKGGRFMSSLKDLGSVDHGFEKDR